MAKSDPTKDADLRPDAWARFERAMAVVVKSPPQHRVKEKKRTPSKPSVRPVSRKKQEKRDQSGD